MQSYIKQGDCFELMKEIPKNSIDLILCDLPYNITNNKWDKTQFNLGELWSIYWEILKENGVIALTASQPFTSKLVSSQEKYFRHEWIWIKNRGSNFANTVREPMKEHESILVFSKGKWTYNQQKQERNGSGLDRTKYNVKYNSCSDNYREFTPRDVNSLSELRTPSSCQKFNVEVGLHPTQKPTKLMEYLIKTYTNENEIVLDNCMGSGSTCVACVNTNRKYIGFELNENYFNIAKERIEKAEEKQKQKLF